MSSVYSQSIDTIITLPSVIDNTTPISAANLNVLRDTIIILENTIGVSPQSSYGTIAERLTAIEAILQQIIEDGGSGGGGTPIVFSNDIIGTNIRQVVVGIQNRPVSSANPTTGQAIIWSGSSWIPTTIPSATTISLGMTQLSLDLSGTAVAPQVVGIRGVGIQNTIPVDKAVPIFNITTGKYDLRPLTSADLGTSFTITSFALSGGVNTVEVGTTITNPAFTSSYSTPASNAFITNTDSIDSPLILTTPFTAGVVVGSFTHNTINASVVFTLTASNGSSTQQSTQTIQYQGRSFFGIGSAGSTGATASGFSAVLVGATGTLSISGLFSSIPGQSFGPVSPTAQKIYFLTPHTATPHTFIDQFTFPFAFNNPTQFTFTNQESVPLQYDLYESTNTLSTAFTILAVS